MFWCYIQPQLLYMYFIFLQDFISQPPLNGNMHSTAARRRKVFTVIECFRRYHSGNGLNGRHTAHHRRAGRSSINPTGFRRLRPWLYQWQNSRFLVRTLCLRLVRHQVRSTNTHGKSVRMCGASVLPVNVPVLCATYVMVGANAHDWLKTVVMLEGASLLGNSDCYTNRSDRPPATWTPDESSWSKWQSSRQ